MNSVANFTPSIKFSEFKLVSFMAYTYTELDLAHDMMCCKMCCKVHLLKHTLFLMYPQIVYIVRKRTF